METTKTPPAAHSERGSRLLLYLCDLIIFLPYKLIKLRTNTRKVWDKFDTNHCFAQRCPAPGIPFSDDDYVVIKHKVPRGAVRHYHPQCAAALNITVDPPSPHTPLPPLVQWQK